MAEKTIQLGPLRSELFREAKWWWRAEFIILGVALGISLADSILTLAPAVSATAVALLTVAAWVVSLYWGRLNDLAQRLTRLIDFHDAFGWAVPAEEMAAVRKATPSGVKNRAVSVPVDADYHASKSAPGVQRAIENLRETAFWSAALSARMAVIVGAGGLITAFGAVVILVVGIKTAQADQTRDNLAIVAMGVLTAGSALGLWTMWWGYYQFAKDADQFVSSADALIARGNADERDCILLWGDYHIVRASSPPIADKVYRKMHDEIDADYRQTYAKP